MILISLIPQCTRQDGDRILCHKRYISDVERTARMRNNYIVTNFWCCSDIRIFTT